MREKDIVSFASGVDTDVKLCLSRMRNKWLDNEVVQSARHRFHLLGFPGTLDNPGFGIFPVCIELEETCLSTALDKLIGFGNQLCIVNPGRKLVVRGDCVSLWIPRNLCYLWGRCLEGIGNRTI